MSATKKLRILYVEDDEAIRTATCLVLKRFAMELFSAKNGAEALELFREKQPDIVITDISMPVMDGLSMARLIKEENPDMPIVFVSAHNDAEQLLEAIELGAEGFLVKPFSLQKLSQILERFERYLGEQEETKKAQQLLNEYKKAVDASAILSIADLEGNIIFVNDKLCEIAEYEREELLGKPHSIFRHPSTPSHVFKELWETIKAGKIWQGILKNRKKSGESYYVDAVIVPIHDEAGNISQFLGLRYEITSLVKAQNALRIALQRAEEADRVKGVFLANMSHEMRTPLNGIIGFSKLLLEESLAPLQREYIEIIDKSSEHLLGIINDILDLSKIESGKFALETLPMKLDEELRAVLSLGEAKTKQKGIKLRYTFGASKDLVVLGDAMRLRQVSMNLLSNAVKFTPEGGEVACEVRVLEELAQTIVLEFSISDTGIGIAPEHLDKIFKPFEQAESSTARNYGGTGLGLPISQELVRLMGGEMKCESAPHRGSRFYFTLEFQKVDAAKPEERTLPKEPRFSARVLVAEDNPINQRLVRIVLEKMGLEVVLASDGAEALELYEAQAFDLVLLDIHMPVMDGLEAHRRLRERQGVSGKAVPIVVLSANAMGSDRAKYLEEGFDACLTKPLIKEELVAVLLKYLPLEEESDSLSLKSKEEGIMTCNERREKMSAMLGLDKESFMELELEFVNYVKRDFDKLLEAMDEGGDSCFKRAHALKGAALNMGFEKMAGVLAEIEHLGKENLPVESRLKEEVQEAWRETLEEVYSGR